VTDKVCYEVNDCSPQILDNFIGQQRAVDQLRICLENSWNDGVRLPHALMSGDAGLGKTALCQIAAKEMGVELKEQLAQNLTTPELLRGFLLEAESKDVLLIDEIHQLNDTVQVTLLRALENGTIFISGSRSSKTHSLTLADFTLLGATNESHSLIKPLRDRFRLMIPFNPYTQPELATILAQRCQQLRWLVEEEVLPRIAALGRGVPRIALRLLESTRRIARAEAADTITQQHFQHMVVLEGLDDKGLTIEDRRYLSILAESDRPVRLNVIATRLDMSSPKTVVELIEKYLIRIGYVMKDERGRFITEKGLEHMKTYPIE